jgi:hypothetical protein
MDPISLPMSSAATIAQSHGKSLKRMNLLRIVLSTEVLVVVSKGCKVLGQLCVDFGAELVRYICSGRQFAFALLYLT